VATTINVSDFYETCATRERGRKFYSLLEPRARAALAARDPLTVSFKRVEFVSASFLDETVVRLLEEHPEIREVLFLENLQPVASRRLDNVLMERGLPSLPAYA